MGDQLRAVNTNFEKSKHADLAVISDLRNQLSGTHHTPLTGANDELRERYLALLNSHPAPHDAVNLLPPLLPLLHRKH